jgi:hypothetical protein
LPDRLLARLLSAADQRLALGLLACHRLQVLPVL